ncbi:hypothetical protein [Streptomyces sp. MB09-02B]|uniref:hypothetical protein n=1 Tax=Streptomyces sp. MB09-02B TaxID=3028667 RepID=UPI0029BAB10C|nr:hypothetical protein [Streptomyces sp. MB09-02B]MDX3641837.1 hypothetical protein [Streptomyces sp. MB09-02B]
MSICGIVVVATTACTLLVPQIRRLTVPGQLLVAGGAGRHDPRPGTTSAPSRKSADDVTSR